VDLKYYQNCHLFAFHKMIEGDPLEVEYLQEDSLEAEDSLEVEDSQEEEDSLEEADTLEVVEYHLEDHLEEAGDHHRFKCPKPNKENW